MNKKSNKHNQQRQSKNRTNKNLIHNLSPNELDKLLNNTDFMEALISYIFTK